MKSYEGQKLDRKIEHESRRVTYQTTYQIDGTLIDMVKVFNQYQFLCFFSIAFPLSYLIAFFGGILTVYFDKLKMVYFLKRPMPQKDNGIGIWNGIMTLIIYLTILCNSAIFAFTIEGFEETNSTTEHKLTVFLLMVLFFFWVKLFSQLVFHAVPKNILTIIERHENVKNNVLKKEFFTFSINQRAGLYLKLNQNNIEDFMID